VRPTKDLTPSDAVPTRERASNFEDVQLCRPVRVCCWVGSQCAAVLLLGGVLALMLGALCFPSCFARFTSLAGSWSCNEGVLFVARYSTTMCAVTPIARELELVLQGQLEHVVVGGATGDGDKKPRGGPKGGGPAIGLCMDVVNMDDALMFVQLLADRIHSVGRRRRRKGPLGTPCWVPNSSCRLRFLGHSCLYFRCVNNGCDDYPSLFMERRKGDVGAVWMSLPRVVCWLHCGPPADCTLYVHHLCYRKACVNPHHLCWVTPSGNSSDERETERRRIQAQLQNRTSGGQFRAGFVNDH
jgi:hypothetical protein